MALPKARGRVLWTKRGLHLAPVNVSSLGVRPTVLRGPGNSVRRHNRTAFYSRPSKRLQHYERRHSAYRSHPPKVMAGLVHMSDEGVRKIRDSERQKHRLESIVSFMQADPTVAAVIERYARLAQEPSLWDYEMQRDFNRDLHRSGRRDG